MIAKLICRYCGKQHDTAECIQRHPSSVRSPPKPCQIAPKLRMCITPDLTSKDNELSRLTRKIVPQDVKVSAPEWRRCQHCRKKIVSTVLRSHEATSCIVRNVTNKLEDLKELVSLFRSREETSGAGKIHLSPIVMTFPSEVRIFEQMKLNVGVIDAVAPISDLFDSVKHVGVSAETTCKLICDSIETIEQRVSDWCANTRAREGAVKLTSDVLHAAPVVVGNPFHSGSTVASESTTSKRGTSPDGPTFDDQTRKVAKRLNSGEICSINDERELEKLRTDKEKRRAKLHAVFAADGSRSAGRIKDRETHPSNMKPPNGRKLPPLPQ